MFKKNTEVLSGIFLVVAMLVFGSIGLVRRYSICSSEVLALTRAFLGCGVLFFIMLIRRFVAKEKSAKGSKKTWILVFVSGVCIGINWVGLFEAYNYVTVSEATVIYYLAPVFAMVLAPIVLHEKMTKRHVICILAALVGTVLISDMNKFGNGGMVGYLWALSAAMLYATVMILNRYMRDIDVMTKTAFQLLSAGIVLLPYTLIKNNGLPMADIKNDLLLLLVLGIGYTGISYYMYFYALTNLRSQTVALGSYLDPVTAILLSVFVLKEHMSLWQWIGAALIIGATVAGDLIKSKKQNA